MSRPEAPAWWPLELPAAAERAWREHRTSLSPALPLDHEAAQGASDLLVTSMARCLDQLLEIQNIAVHAHLINGWGNARLRGSTLGDAVLRFVRLDHDARPYLPQGQPRGDMHPWQTFAYAIMAGIDVDAPLGGSDITLRRLAVASRQLATGDGCELGHLLFALSFLAPPETWQFHVGVEPLDAIDLMDRAVEAHCHGPFDLCHKFHLTEGICAAAALHSPFETYREVAQHFVDGQMEILVVASALLQAISVHSDSGGTELPALVDDLRHALAIDASFERHCYLVGHAIELACFATRFGYRIHPEQWNAAIHASGLLNRWLPMFMQHVALAESSSLFAHYRRAISLLSVEERRAASGSEPDSRDLTLYTADFDVALADIERVDSGASGRSLPSLVENGAFRVADASPPHVRPTFSAVLAAYEAVAPDDLPARGHSAGFRKVLPRSWPREVHYEFVDYGRDVGIEIHIESDWWSSRVSNVMRELSARVSSRLDGVHVEWDPSWFGGCGRLRVLCSADDPWKVARTMRLLIEQTRPTLESTFR